MHRRNRCTHLRKHDFAGALGIVAVCGAVCATFAAARRHAVRIVVGAGLSRSRGECERDKPAPTQHRAPVVVRIRVAPLRTQPQVPIGCASGLEEHAFRIVRQRT